MAQQKLYEAEAEVEGKYWERRIRSHFGSNHILFERARCFFPFTSVSGFVLSKCLQPSFVVSHPFSWHVRVMERMCQFLPVPASSSNMGSPNGSLPDIEGTGYRASTMEEKINEMFVQVAKLPLLIQSVSRFENCVQTHSQTVASYGAKITNIEQMVSSLVARVTILEMNATSVSSGSGSARSGNILGHSDGSIATGSLGSHVPGSSDDNRNTRRRLDTFSSPEDEQARSAVFLRFFCEQYHKGITKWINNLWEETNMPSCNKLVRIHGKAGSVSVRLVFETRAKCQDSVARYKDDGIPYAIDSPFCCANTNSTVRQPKSIGDREIGKQFAPLWRELADQLKLLFPDGDDESAFIILALDPRSHVHSIQDRRNGVGKPVFKPASLGRGQLFTLVSPDLSVPGVSPKVLQRGSLSSQHSQCVMAAFSPPRLFAAWRVEAPFPRFTVSMGSTLCALSGS